MREALDLAIQMAETARSNLDHHMRNLSSEEIGEAFDNYGYEGMTPQTSKFEKVSLSTPGQYVYRCWWTHEGEEEKGLAFIWVKDGKLVADT